VRLGLLTVIVTASAVGVADAQGDVRAQLADRLAPSVAASVARIADSAFARHLPVQPIVDKANEGAVKNVPGDRLIAAASMVLHQLDQSASAIRAAGGQPEADAIEAGAVAINAGLRQEDVEAVVRRTRAPYTPVTTLRVAATLAALGVPGPKTIDLVGRAVDSHQLGDGLLDLPREVQAQMAGGSSASEAAEHVGHGDASETGAASTAHGSPSAGHAHKP
jgi:hypothetical protein